MVKRDQLNGNDEGYPYNLLIQRTDQVKLIYQGDKTITCRVEVKLREKQWLSDTQQVTVNKFEDKPLKSCLSRSLAKEILASTF